MDKYAGGIDADGIGFFGNLWFEGRPCFEKIDSAIPRCRRYQSSTVMIPFLVIATLLNILLGVLALKKGFHASVNRWFAVLCFSIALWLLADLMWELDYLSYENGLRLPYSFGNIAIASSLLWVMSFVRFPNIKRWSFLLYSSVVLMAVLFFTPDAMMIFDSQGEHWRPTFGFGVYAVLVVSVFLTNIGLILKATINAQKLKKGKYYSVLLAFLLTSGLVGVSSFIFPAIGIQSLVYVDVYASTFFIIFLFIAIMRYSLLDIRIIIQKSLIYSVTSILALLFFVVIVNGKNEFFRSLFNVNEATLYFGAAISVILLVQPLQFIVRKVIDKFIFSEKIDLFHATNKAGFLESKSQDLRDYSEKARAFMMQKMHAFDCELLIWDEEEKQYQQYYQSGRHIVLLPSDPVLQILQRAKRHFFTEDLRRYAEQEGLEPEVIKTCLRKLHALNASIVVPLIVHDALLGLFLINVDTKDIDISDIQISGFAIEVSRGLSACLLMNYRDYIKI